MADTDTDTKSRAAAKLAPGTIVTYPATGRRGLVISSTTTHGDGTERVSVDDKGEKHPATAYVVAWFNEISDPIDPADLEAS